MDQILDLIFEYGYWIVFLGTLMEGETVVALGGFAAYLGHLKLEMLLPIAIIGATIGDHIFFFLGRIKGKQILERKPHWQEKVAVVHLKLEQHANWLIYGSRFMYGFRAMIPVVLGTSNIPTWKFTFFNMLGAITWGVLFVFGGYTFGSAIESFLGNVKAIEKYVILGVLAVVGLIQGLAWYRRRARRMAHAKDSDTQV
ncbi:MAG TPA: DedA family protein [Candidatus Paceibacterota bacterium]|nr:DedA family protein [Candidatus Paceibacterota bacterium]